MSFGSFNANGTEINNTVQPQAQASTTATPVDPPPPTPTPTLVGHPEPSPEPEPARGPVPYSQLEPGSAAAMAGVSQLATVFKSLTIKDDLRVSLEARGVLTVAQVCVCVRERE